MFKISFWFCLAAIAAFSAAVVFFNPRVPDVLSELPNVPAIIPTADRTVATVTILSPQPSSKQPEAKAAVAGAATTAPPVAAPTPPSCSAGLAAQVLEKVNDFRLAQGKSEFYGNAAYDNFACAHSQEMARAGYFSHSDAAGRSFAERVSASGLSIWRENLAQAGNPTAIARLWEKSAGHRENILQSEGKVGVGVVSSGGTLTVTMVFGN